MRSDFGLFGGDEGEADTTGGRTPAPCASPRAPCRDGRVERLSTTIGWPSRRRRRARAVARGPELQKRRATMSASRVAPSYGVPVVVFLVVVVVRCHPRRCSGSRGGRSGAAVEVRRYIIVSNGLVSVAWGEDRGHQTNIFLFLEVGPDPKKEKLYRNPVFECSWFWSVMFSTFLRILRSPGRTRHKTRVYFRNRILKSGTIRARARGHGSVLARTCIIFFLPEFTKGSYGHSSDAPY